MAWVNLHHDNDQTSYDVSVVDDFNVGLSVTPHEGRGNCPVLACCKNLTETCPGELQLRSSAGSILACKSGCEAFRIDELCCHNMYNSPRTCRASKYSEFFKRECP
uniref:Osmotin-like protein n=1 Tax=Zea mays TaxID=4577 RepID=A0A804Q4D8_MAIZE